MLNPLKLKMFICKMITCWIGPSGKRKLIREFLFWFSIKDYHRFKNADYAIVSLGNSCLTRVLAVASGVKPRRFYGEKSCPFDLCRSNDVKRIVELIENNFSDFFKNINLDDFPHDDKLTLRQFKKRYQRRIKNFLELQKSDKRIYYIYSDFNSMQPDVRDLKKSLSNIKVKTRRKTL